MLKQIQSENSLEGASGKDLVHMCKRLSDIELEIDAWTGTEISAEILNAVLLN
jgi:hypothetical protein